MHEADAEQAAAFFDAEAFGQVERVVVAVPGEDAAVAEKLRDFGGIVLANSNRNRRAALVEALGIADAEKAQLGNGEQAVEQACEKRGFVLVRYAIRGDQGAAAVFCGGIMTAAKLGKVVDGGADSRDQLLHLRAGFPTVG